MTNARLDVGVVLGSPALPSCPRFWPSSLGSLTSPVCPWEPDPWRASRAALRQSCLPSRRPTGVLSRPQGRHRRRRYHQRGCPCERWDLSTSRRGCLHSRRGNPWETPQSRRALRQSLDRRRHRRVLRSSPRRPNPNDPHRPSRRLTPGFVARPSQTGAQLNALPPASSTRAIRPKSVVTARRAHSGSCGSASIHEK
jgi:hypothetical protein